jgi:sortase A
VTAVRPESSAGHEAGPPPYGDIAEFSAAVDQLADPLSDPLPGGGQQGAAGYPPAGGDAGWGYAQQPHAQQPHAQPHPQQPHPQQQPYQQPYQQAQPQAYPQHQAPAGGGYGYPQGYPQQGYEGYDATAYAPQGPAQHPQALHQPVTGYEPQQGYQGPQEPQQAQPPQQSAGYDAAQDVPGPRRARTSSRARLEATAELAVPEDLLNRDGDRDGAAGDPGADTGSDADGPATGGRAERRKAARRGGAPRRRADTPEGAAGGTDATARQPVSRMEAKRAARAAKAGPGVIASQVTGELFITMGVLMLLFVVYQLWYTNVLADEAANGATKNLQNQWNAHQTSSDDNEPDTFPEGQTFAIIYIPKLDVKAPIAEGVDKDKILDKGEVGHYSGAQETAMPWNSSGNFALAGHRNTHGEPFRYINKLVPGDKVVVETSGMYYTYAITSMLPQTSPANVSVIEPVPPGSGFTKPGRYITLTTCTPEFTSTYRMIVWGRMVAEQPRSKGTPAALLGG